MKRLVKYCLAIGSLAGFLSACVPQVNTAGPKTIVLNAPTEARVEGLADQLEASLKAGLKVPLGFVASSQARFDETHRDMYNNRAPLQAAFSARSFGANLAILVGAPNYTRDVREFHDFFGFRRQVSIEVNVEVKVVEPEHATVLATFTSPTYMTERFESGENDLVAPEDDEDLQRGIEQGLEYVIPPLETFLNSYPFNP